MLTAIQGADIIVHRYGMKKFRLLVYGSMTHDVVYCRRCQDAIERLKLTDNVWLKGKGRPAAVSIHGTEKAFFVEGWGGGGRGACLVACFWGGGGGG